MAAKSPCWVEFVIPRIKEKLVKQLISNGNRNYNFREKKNSQKKGVICIKRQTKEA